VKLVKVKAASLTLFSEKILAIFNSKKTLDDMEMSRIEIW